MLPLSLVAVLVQCWQAVDALYCPAECDCSVKDAVRCSRPTITDIASLGLPKNMTYIVISGTGATELNDNCFRKMPVVLRLLMESNEIATVTPGAFQDLVELKTLKLTNNKVVSLPTGVFDKLVHLEQLFLDQNSLTYLEQNIFNQLVTLKELFLNKNKLSVLHEGLFQTLRKLKVLNLSRNSLSSLPSTIFESLKCLEKLLLYENKLTSVQFELFENLGQLVELSCFANRIESIAPGAFNRLHKLEILKLSKNKLQTLPSALLLHLPNLTTLSLYDNPLQEVPEALFGVMERLTQLWIYKTSLFTLPDFVFSNLTSLELLVLTVNPRLSYLPRNAFSGLNSLVELSLHTNNLAMLDEDVFQDLDKLQTLSLYNNKFRSLPRTIFHPLKNLVKIYLNSTELETLSGDFLSSSPNLTMVLLHNNPWLCDCDLNNFNSWLKANLDTVLNPMSLICGGPLNLHNVPLLLTVQFQCEHPSSGQPIAYISGSSPLLVTQFYKATEQPGVLATGNTENSQRTSLTTATAFTVDKTTQDASIERRKYPSTSSALPTSTRCAFSAIDTTQSARLAKVHQTVSSAQTAYQKVKTTNIAATTLNTSTSGYRESDSNRNGRRFFPSKTPYSKLFIFLHLFSLTGQFVTIVIAACILFKLHSLVYLHSFILPVILLKVSHKGNDEA